MLVSIRTFLWLAIALSLFVLGCSLFGLTLFASAVIEGVKGFFRPIHRGLTKSCL